MKFRIAIALVITLVVLTFAPAIHAQQTQPEKMVSIPESQLTDQQKTSLVQRDMQERISQYGKWAGIGHEVGTTINEGLAAITTQANNFAQTLVGKWTVFVIVFKVVGEKLVQYFVGISMFLVGIPLWIWSYRKYLPKKYVTKVNYGDNGKKTSVEYGYGYGDGTNKLDKDIASNWCIGHWVLLFVYLGVIFAVMFAGN
jgi:hypothetical protein